MHEVLRRNKRMPSNTTSSASKRRKSKSKSDVNKHERDAGLAHNSHQNHAFSSSKSSPTSSSTSSSSGSKTDINVFKFRDDDGKLVHICFICMEFQNNSLQAIERHLRHSHHADSDTVSNAMRNIYN